MFRKLFMMLVMLAVVGCGFHLRGTIPWPNEYQNVYLDGYNPLDRGSFFAAMTKFFPDNVNIVENADKADVTIKVLSEHQSTRTVSGLAYDRDTEEVVTLRMVVQVDAKDDVVIMPATELMRERDFRYNESDLLSKSNDLQSVTRILKQETAAMFMRRLEAAMRNHLQ